MKKLEDYTFYKCKNLTSVTLPEGLESISDGCFDDTAIKQLVIPKSVMHIGNRIVPPNTIISRPADYHPEGVLTGDFVR